MEYTISREKKIAMIFPFFGKKPEWFDFFLLSCSRNIEIDWIFFSDCLNSIKVYQNIFFHPMTLSEFNDLATKQLGFVISIKYPYKICDLKPAYGKIFHDYIRNYPYWGYGDIDLIFGDILKFLPDDWLGKYDLVSNDIEFIPGHLCILRNSPEVVNLFKQSSIYQKIFQSPVIYSFDEVSHWIKIIPSKMLLIPTKFLKNQYIIKSKMFVAFCKKYSLLKRLRKIRHLRNKGNYNPVLKDFTSIIKFNLQLKNIGVLSQKQYICDITLNKKKFKNWQIIWDNGQLFIKEPRQEVIYYHFLIRKYKKDFKIDNFNTDADIDRFIISNEGIKNL